MRLLKPTCFAFILLLGSSALGSPDKVRFKIDPKEIFPHGAPDERNRYLALAADQNPQTLIESLRKGFKEKAPAIIEEIFGKDLSTHWRLSGKTADEMAHLQGYIETQKLRGDLEKLDERAKKEGLSKEEKAQLAADILIAKDRLLFLEIMAQYLAAMNRIKQNPPEGMKPTDKMYFQGWQIQSAFESYQRMHPNLIGQAEYWKNRKDHFGKGVHDHFLVEDPKPLGDAGAAIDPKAAQQIVDARILAATNRAIWIEKEILRLKLDNKPLAKEFLQSLKTPENQKIILEAQLQIDSDNKKAP